MTNISRETVVKVAKGKAD